MGTIRHNMTLGSCFRLLYVLGVPASVGFWAPVLAQSLESTIPPNQAPLLGTFPPPPAEQSPPGTGKFVVFTREEVGKPGQWDFIAGAWECIPSRPGVPVTKRVEFCHSSRNAEPLLDVLARDGGEHSFPRFVKLQVGTGGAGYAVNLYDINYRTWEIRSLWQGHGLDAFGVMKGSIFCQDDGKWFCLDSTTGAIRNETPFVPLGVDGSFWLVRKNGEKSGSWSYDPSSEGYIGHFTDEEPILGYEQAFLSPDGRSRAWILADMPTGWQGGELRGTFLLQRDGRRGEIRVPIVMQALAGSDVPVIPRGTSLAFTPDGAVEFSATTGKTGADDRVWSVEIATGKIVESRRPHPPQAERDFSMFHGAPAPEYLRPYLKDLTHFGRRGLAPAFLLSMGVLKQRPEYPACEAGVSPDGRHILYKANEGPLADVFIYGDLQTKQILRWPRPAGMKPGNSMEFVWVEAP